MASSRTRLLLSGLLAVSLSGAAALASAEPAAIASSGLREKAETSFRQFARSWLGDMRQREAKAREAGQHHTGPGADWQVELRPTGKARTPYVGILYYTEIRMQCSGSDACQRVGSSGISEIFRFQNGKWVY